MQPDGIIANDRIARWRRRVWNIVQQARTQPDFIEASMTYLVANGNQLAVVGWRAVRAGEYEYARHCFRAALHLDPYATSAWVGLSRVTCAREERRAYLQAAFDLQYLVTHLEKNDSNY